MPQVDELQRQRTAGALTGYRAGRALRRLPGAILSLGCLFLVGALFPSFVFAQATLENPAPNSFQSGLGVISGWACHATTIEIAFNDGPPQEAAAGTSRGDTQAACGDTDNGFGLLFNWNLLGDGIHTVSALADGVEFASVTVLVTTFGEEFLREASATLPLADFPDAGATRTLRWQESQQNFVLTDGRPSQGGGTSGAPPHVLENPAPGSFQSGLGLISGWVCDAQTITISFDGGPPQEAAYGTSRGDTQGACGDTDNGFGLLFNWNLLDDGLHTVAASADGVEFARVEVTVTTLGTEFRRGLSHEVILPDFPAVGSDIVLRWQETQQNFVLSEAAPTQRLIGVTPTLTLPPGVTAVQPSVASLISDTAEVRASPESTLLLADDAGGTVLLALANMDGGWLGEATGEVEVSIASTAIVLVALAAGYAIPEIDQGVAGQIVGHAQYPALLAALTQLMVADKNFLDRLFAHPEVVALIREVAAFRAAPAYQPLSSHTVLPDGIKKDDFGADSSWAANAPWQWFGTATRFFLPVQPPFLAQSLAADIQATANPNFVDYVLWAYTGDSRLDWDHAPRNASLLDKLRNSGAARRRLSLAPEIDRVVFVRYRATTEDPPVGAVYSFLNTFSMITAVAGLFNNVGVVKRTLRRLSSEDTVHELAPCATELVNIGRHLGAAVPQGALTRDGLRALADAGEDLTKSVATQCARGILVDMLKESIRKVGLNRMFADLAKRLAGPLGWIVLVGEGLYQGINETAPVLTSYLAPSARGAEYYLGWAKPHGRAPYLACVSEEDTCVPLAPTNLRITEVGADFVELAWDAPEGEGAVSYNIYYSTSPTEPESLIENVSTAGDRITGTVIPGECYRVSAVSAEGVESEKTAQVCVDESMELDQLVAEREFPYEEACLACVRTGYTYYTCEYDELYEYEVQFGNEIYDSSVQIHVIEGYGCGPPGLLIAYINPETGEYEFDDPCESMLTYDDGYTVTYQYTSEAYCTESLAMDPSPDEYGYVSVFAMEGTKLRECRADGEERRFNTTVDQCRRILGLGGR